MPSSQDLNFGKTMENAEIDVNDRSKPNKETGPEQRIALYKCNSKVTESQQERRQKFLEEQKERRGGFIDATRNLSDLFVQDEVDEGRNIPRYRPPRNKRFCKKLMQSEYFTDVPEDLAEKWLFKVCPEGSRCLLVAHGATTKCYWENGQEFYSFGTNFPGGCNNPSEQSDAYTILDCVIIRRLRTILVFDVLAWNSTAMMECTADMRFYWLQSKFDEDASYCISRHKNNPYKIMHVPWGFAEKKDIEKALTTTFKIDDEVIRYSGVLFYHKEGFYSTKRTPLVGWLLPCMLTELFDINLLPDLCRPKPPGYENIHSYIEDIISSKKAKKRARNLKKLKDKEMVDVSDNREEEMEGEMTTESGADVEESAENANMEIESVYQEAAKLEMS